MVRTHSSRFAPRRAPGLLYEAGFVSTSDREAILRWLSTIHPLWEERFSEHHPPPPGQSPRRLLRPVYWLGNWQFACLNYYHPPKGVLHRCVQAEAFPPVLDRLIKRVEKMARKLYRGPDMPQGWHLNTCLVNMYGDRREGEKWVDTARVGEHKDFEPGPVASISLGERAMFQFVSSRRPGERNDVVFQQWLDDSSLQVFGGPMWKERLFHRVQRVDTRDGYDFKLHVADFRTRRINFTFRYVPDHHVVPFRKLPVEDQQDVRGYMETLAVHASFFRRALTPSGA